MAASLLKVADAAEKNWAKADLRLFFNLCTFENQGFHDPKPPRGPLKGINVLKRGSSRVGGAYWGISLMRELLSIITTRFCSFWLLNWPKGCNWQASSGVASSTFWLGSSRVAHYTIRWFSLLLLILRLQLTKWAVKWPNKERETITNLGTNTSFIMHKTQIFLG